MTHPTFTDMLCKDELNEDGAGLQQPQITLGVSSCLLGEKVRFDSGHKKNAYIVHSLSQFFCFAPFCPEMAIGLGTPRPTIRLIKQGEGIRCVNTKDDTIDVTDALINSAMAQQANHQQLSGYIVKKDSPSCGMERVKVYHNGHAERSGTGLFTVTLMAQFPHLPIEEEGRLNDAVLRENFIQRVYIYHRWQKLLEGDADWKAISQFHARHKYIFMSHNQNKAKQLGHWLAQNHPLPKVTLAAQYLEQMMALLRVKATRKTHVNTLTHVMGYLKNHLSAQDKQELLSTIEQYRQGYLPLVVPIILLKHHFSHHPHPYIADSYYMQPYPGELMLLNSV